MAIKIGYDINESGGETLFPDNASCASACFWLFAVGQPRVMVSNAELGVHGIKDPQGNDYSAGTFEVARFAKRVGIPDSIKFQFKRPSHQ